MVMDVQRTLIAIAKCRTCFPPVRVAAAIVLTSLAFGAATEAFGADTAQSLLFDAPYLDAFTPPAALRYRFEHSTSDERLFGSSFADDVIVDIRPPEDPAVLNSVVLKVFTGERARTLGPLSDVKGNPLTMLFLERDMFHMRRQVQVSPVLFRNTMRRAMRETARVEEAEIGFAGRILPAKRVTVRPFAGPDNPPQFAQFEDKAYVFTVSPEIPGGIYEIRATLPDASGGTLVEDRLTFVGKHGQGGTP